MAFSSQSDSQRDLLISNPSRIAKDTHGSDNLIPLSPQWLLPKSGDNKPGQAIGEVILHSGNAGRSDNAKSWGNGEQSHDTDKKKDIFRPSLNESDTGRHDRWRDEERDTSSAIRKDRWRAGDKELSDTRKTDRWVENSSTKYSVDGRRGTSDRRTDTSNKDNTHEQWRESKWNTRWGPDDKERDGLRDKWIETSKDSDMVLDKGSHYLTNRGNDEKDMDSHRLWKSTSSQIRPRLESSHPQSHTPGKQGSAFAYGRGRGEKFTTYSPGHGRIGSGGSSSNNPSAQSHSLQLFPDKINSHDEPSPLRYNRNKLLDLYRKTNTRSFEGILKGFEQVFDLTLSDSLEPLAFCEPTTEELGILNSIDKGDITSSGVPQKSKDGSAGRSSTEFMQTRRAKPDNTEGSTFEKHMQSYGPKSEMDEVQNHQMYLDGKFNAEDFRDDGMRRSKISTNRTENSDVGWSQLQKVQNNQWEQDLTNSSQSRVESLWQQEDRNLRRQSSVVLERGQGIHKSLQSSPEDVVLIYKDPQGELQGPFSGIDIIGWFEAGYFGIDLQVRLASASNNSPFSSLGDVMPHLRAKARPPPGFNVSKQSEPTEVSIRTSLSDFAKLHIDSSEIDVNELKPIGSATSEAENIYLESLMSGKQRYSGNNSCVVDPHQDTFNLYPSQNLPSQTPFGVQQPRFPLQNQSYLSNLLSQSVDNPSAILTPENLLSPGFSQNPQLLSMLQKQYKAQLHSQALVPTQGLSVLDKLLLLKQQQKHEEQQLLLLQQQQLLSQVLSVNHNSNQRCLDPSYMKLQPTPVSLGKTPVDQPKIQASHEQFQTPTVSDVSNECVNNFVNFPPLISQNVSYGVSESSLNFPHMFGSETCQKFWSASSTFPEQIDDFQQNEVLKSAEVNRSCQPGVMNKFSHEPHVQLKSFLSSDEPAAIETSKINFEPSVGNFEKQTLVVDQINQLAQREAVIEPERCNEKPLINEHQKSDVQDARKTSEKKSRKQKSKTQSDSEQTKGVSKGVPLKKSKQTDILGANISGTKFEPQIAAEDGKSCVASEAVDSQKVNTSLPSKIVVDVDIHSEIWQDVSPLLVHNNQSQSRHRGWKPAPGFKAKSLLEIQEEEQRNEAQRKSEIVSFEVNNSVNSMTPSTTPWAGFVANLDPKASRQVLQDAASGELNFPKIESTISLKSNKSQLHDLLAGDTFTKSTEKDVVALEDSQRLPSLPVIGIQMDLNDDNFIDARDTKKNRKKAAKAKGVAAKPPVSNVSVETSPASSLVERNRNYRIAQQEEVLPVLPSGPSLGDFVQWKGESVNVSYAPAWSTDSGNQIKPTSLRDILKEQGKKGSPVLNQTQVSVPKKLQPTQRPISAISPPCKVAPHVQSNSNAFVQSKNKGDDDLFWGPIDQTKQETKQTSFPDLTSQGSRGTKGIPIKGSSSGSVGKQKSVSGKSYENNPLSKHSEAMGFKDWCEKESFRLTGTNDTSVLEFCLKQSRSEAEMILVENLGSFDPNREFIDKFLNYMELLPSDVIEIVCQSLNNHKADAFAPANMDSQNASAETKGGTRKKKGKKGKKAINPLVLGFNVVSNRIMMGEIQNVED